MIYQISIPWPIRTGREHELAVDVGEENLFHCYTIHGDCPTEVWEVRCDEQLLSFILLKFNATYLREIYEQY